MNNHNLEEIQTARRLNDSVPFDDLQEKAGSSLEEEKDQSGWNSGNKVSYYKATHFFTDLNFIYSKVHFSLKKIKHQLLF